MKIGITNDHRGVKVKQFLTEYLNALGYNVIDYGTDSEEPADFPDYAKKLGDGIINHEVDLGIAICGTGIGMSIALKYRQQVKQRCQKHITMPMPLPYLKKWIEN